MFYDKALFYVQVKDNVLKCKLECRGKEVTNRKKLSIVDSQIAIKTCHISRKMIYNG